MTFAFDSKYCNRAPFETWLHRVGGRAEYRRDDEGTFTATASADPETIIVTGGPALTIEEACVLMMKRLDVAGQRIDGFTHPE